MKKTSLMLLLTMIATLFLSITASAASETTTLTIHKPQEAAGILEKIKAKPVKGDNEYGDAQTVTSVINRLIENGVPAKYIFDEKSEVYLIDEKYFLLPNDSNHYGGSSSVIDGKYVITICTQCINFQNTLVHEIGHQISYSDLQVLDGWENGNAKAIAYEWARGYMQKFRDPKILSSKSQSQLPYKDRIDEWFAYDFSYLYGFSDQPGYQKIYPVSATRPGEKEKILFQKLLKQDDVTIHEIVSWLIQQREEVIKR